MTKFLTVQEDVQKEKKVTVLTHTLSANGWIKKLYPIDYFLKIVYLGNCDTDGDMFACYSDLGNIIISKGIKGDEFNQ